MQLCEKCGAEAKIIPSGVSKRTGKKYNSFYKCEACGNTGNLSPSQPITPPKADNASNEGLNAILDAIQDLKEQLDRIEGGILRRNETN